MSHYKVEIRKLKVTEYQSLRNTTGWASLEDDIVNVALEKDLFSVCVLNNEKTIGIGRVIGDGAIYFYIQDVIVLPEYQNKGIGKLIMDQIELYLGNKANNNSFIGLMSAEGVKNFYTKFGYLERPASRPGMFKIVKK